MVLQIDWVFGKVLMWGLSSNFSQKVVQAVGHPGSTRLGVQEAWLLNVSVGPLGCYVSPHSCSLGLAWELSDYSDFVQGGWLPLAPRHPHGSCQPRVTVPFPLHSIGYKLVIGSAQIQEQGATYRYEYRDLWLTEGPSFDTS